MITLNGSKFAETETEFLDSLFNTGGTCKGYAKRYKRHVKLFNMQKDLIGVVNRFGLLACATETIDGTWYSFATIKEVGTYESFRASREEPASLGVATGSDKGDTVYRFDLK